MPSSPRAADTSVNHRIVTVVVCLSLAAVVAAMSSLNVAVPDIARDTRATQTDLAWIIDAYSLVFAALLLPAGALGDRYGRRRTLLTGLAIFGSASMAATTVSGPAGLIVLRGVMGLGAALVMPATLSTITSTFPLDKRTTAVSVWAGVAGGSAIFGLLASGFVLEFWSWRSVFAINVVLAVAAFVASWRVVPESADQRSPALDIGGVALSVAGLAALVYSIIEAPTAGWFTWRTVVGIIGGIGVLIVFIIYELRHRAPMIDPRVFTRRGLSAGSLSIFVQFFTFFGFIFAILQYLQFVRGDSPLMSAVSMLPMAAVMMPSARLAPVIAVRLGARFTCSAGLVLVAAGVAIMSQLDVHTSYWLFMAGLTPLGIGMGTAMTPATSAITGALPSAQQGVASAINDLSREVGGALGIAVLGSLLTQGYRSHLELPHIPPAIEERARDSFAAASHAGGQIAARADAAFTHGLQLALLTATGVVLVAAVAVALTMPSKPTAPAADDVSIPPS